MKGRAFFYIILAGVLWGTSGIFVHYLAPFGLSSLQMTSIRGTISSIAMAVYVLIHNKTLFKANLKQTLLYIGSGFAQFLTASSYYISMQETSVSTAVVLMYTAPIIVMAYSVLFLGEKLTKLKTVSVAGMIFGCALVSGIIGGFKFSGFGIAMGFLSGISYSAYNIFTKIQMRHKCNPVTASMYCFVFMAVFSYFVSKPAGIVEIASAAPLSIPLMIGCGVCTCVLPYFLYTVALKYLPAGTASALGIIEPMAATLFSVTLLGEVLDVYSFVGIVLIIGSVFLLSKGND